MVKPQNVPPETLEVALGRLLTEAGLTLALAESCTGGLIAHRITNVPGSSTYFLGGVVAYSNEAKQRILGVAQATLNDHGAVSEETAREMARGARRLFGADLAASATGIAGPGGGMPGKPVGLVYIALSSRAGERCERFVWSGDREANKWESAEAALRMLIEQVQAENLAKVPQPSQGSPPAPAGHRRGPLRAGWPDHAVPLRRERPAPCGDFGRPRLGRCRRRPAYPRHGRAWPGARAAAAVARLHVAVDGAWRS